VRTSVDMELSMKRYMALALGGEWEVRLADEGGTFTPPFALVEALADAVYDGPVVHTDVTQPVTITCYPEPQQTVRESRLVAEGVRDLLYEAFRVGVDLGRPMRVPLYDYAGKEPGEPSDARHPSDYLRLLSFSARLLPDTVDSRRIAVVSDVRVTWRRRGRVSFGKLVEEVHIAEQVSGHTVREVVVTANDEAS
jgi:hypothetical protein